MTLKQYLSLEGNSAAQLAAALNVAASTIYRAANGDVIPSKEQMRAIFDATGGKVTPNDFYGVGEKAA